MTEQVELTISPIQLIVLQSGLKLEIMSDCKMQMTARETALHAYKRLIADKAGWKTGRGLKGRQEALEVVEYLLDQVG